MPNKKKVKTKNPTKKKKSKKVKTRKIYRVLALDGGGVRGLFTLGVLKSLEKDFPNFLENIDLVSGTSTGGIIALGIAKGLSINKMISLYKDKAKDIFDDSIYDDIRDLFGIIGAEYSNDKLEQLMIQYFGEDTELGDLKKKVLIPTFQLMSDTPDKAWKSKYFNNYSDEEWDWYEKVYKVAMRTSAAPTYFPTYDGYVDGGVVANNPSSAALFQVMSLKDKLGISVDDIRVLSVGTGFNPNYIPVDAYSKQKDWGEGQWVKVLIDLMIDGSMGDSSFFCRNLIKDKFKRVNKVLPQKIEMDTTKSYKLKQLLSWGEDLYKKSPSIKDWMRDNWS